MLTKKFLIAVVIISLISVICLLLIFIGIHIRPEDDLTTCQSSICVQASADILKAIDQSIDPCDNFYQFTCGRLFDNIDNEVDDNNNDLIASPFTKLHQKIKNQKTATITHQQTNNLNKRDTNNKQITMMKRFYQSCIDLNAIDSNNNTQFMEIIDKLSGGWPIIINNNAQWDFDWINFTIETSNLRISDAVSFIKLIISRDYNNQYLPQLVISYPITVYDANSYFDLMTAIASSAFGVDSIGSELHKMIGFQKELNSIINGIIAFTFEPIISIVTIRNLTTKYPKINWFHLLNGLANGYATFTEDSQVIIDRKLEIYLYQLDVLLSRSTKTVVANYLVWSLIYVNGPFLFSKIRRVYNNFQINILGKKQVSRHEFCLKIVTENRFWKIGYIQHINQLISHRLRISLNEMIESIKTNVVDRLTKIDGLNEAIKQLAIIKAVTVDVVIGAPSNALYKDLNEFEFSSDNIITMRMELLRQNIKNDFEILYQNITLDDGINDNLLIEKFINSEVSFSKTLNILAISGLILQDPFYDSGRPNYLNYGSIGQMITRELLSGYNLMAVQTDNVTSSFDSNISEGIYNQKIQCLNLSSTNLRSLKEIIDGDFSGLDVSYGTYLEWVKSHGSEIKLPGLNYTSNQLYWIQANIFGCHYESEKNLTRSLKTNEAVKASRYFADDFNCPIGSKMNPDDDDPGVGKCQIF